MYEPVRAAFVVRRMAVGTFGGFRAVPKGALTCLWSVTKDRNLRSVVRPSFAPAARAFALVLSKPALRVARQNRGDNAPGRGCQVDSPIGNLRYRRVPEDPDFIASKACDRRGFCCPSGVHRFALDFRVLPHTIIGDFQSKLHARSGVQNEKTVCRRLLGGARPANLGRPTAACSASFENNRDEAPTAKNCRAPRWTSPSVRGLDPQSVAPGLGFAQRGRFHLSNAPVGGSSRRCRAKRRICRANVNGSEPVSGTSRRNTSTCPGTPVCLREEETPLGRSSTGRPHMA